MKSWEERWNEVPVETGSSPSHAVHINKALGLNGDGTLLDVGCGNGDLLAGLNIKKQNTVGMDISQKKCNAVLATGVYAFRGDIREKIDLSARLFDYVVCNSVFHYIPNEDLSRLLDELERVCKKDGMIFVGHVPEQRYSDLIEKIRHKFFTILGITHYSRYNRKEFEKRGYQTSVSPFNEDRFDVVKKNV